MIRLPGNIPLVIQPSFWVLAFLLAWVSGQTLMQCAIWVLIVFGSVLFHELGHATTALCFGSRTRIELNLFGGITMRFGHSLSRLQEFIVVLMGPVCSFLLSGIAFVLASMQIAEGNLLYLLKCTCIANIYWGGFNLVPVQPLDGGKLLAIVFDALFGPKGLRFSYLISTIMAIACSALLLVLGAVFAGALFLICAFESFRSWQTARILRTGKGDNELLEELAKAQFDWEHGQPERAMSRLEQIVKKNIKGELFFRALQQLASYLLASQQPQKTYALLAPYKQSLDSALIKQFQLACYQLGDWMQCLDAGKKAFLEEQDISCAILNAFCSAKLRQAEQAINWLRCVKQMRPVDMKALLAADDFDSIRQEPLFVQFSKQIS